MAVQVQGSLPDLIVTAAPATVTKNENAQATFNITVKNQGTSAAGPFAVALKFDGQYRPDLQGICAFNNGLGAGVTQQCTTTSVTMNFPGGDMQAVADWAEQVTETNESNNTLNGGRLKVTPKTPNEDATHNDIVTWPSGGWYAFVDRSGIETGFDVRIRRASSSCSSWTTVTTKSHGAKSGTGQQTVGTYNFAHGYCWKIEVKVKGLYADSTWKSEYAPVWYP